MSEGWLRSFPHPFLRRTLTNPSFRNLLSSSEAAAAISNALVKEYLWRGNHREQQRRRRMFRKSSEAAVPSLSPPNGAIFVAHEYY